MRPDPSPHNFAVFRTAEGLHGFCPQDFLIKADSIVMRGLTPEDAEEIADQLNDGAPDPVAAVAAIIGGVRFMAPVGRAN